jgi:iron complex outermembrane receptor protein
MKVRCRKIFGVVAAFVTLTAISSLPVTAQIPSSTTTSTAAAVAAPAPDDAANPGLAEIVVTAEKRSETAQRLPAAVSVMTEDVLVQHEVVDLLGIQNLLPSAKMNYESSVIQVFIRGVGSQLDQPFIPTSVGLNLNDAPVCRYCAAGSFYDIQRVEVLPGPQGTLYGSSAIGGVVNVVTNRPTHEWMTDATIDYGNFNTRHETVVQNVPVTPNWSLRAAADFYDDDGFNNNGTYDQHSKASRLSSLYTEGDVSAFLTGSFYVDNFRPSPVQYLPIPAGGAYSYPATELATKEFYPPNGLSYGYGNSYSESSMLAGQFDLTLGDIVLSYLPAAIHAFVGGDRDILGFVAPTTASVKQYSNELRASSSTGKINWIAGLYQLWNHSTYDIVFGPNLSGMDTDTTNRSYAAFGQLTYSVSDRARLTAGVRESKDSLESPQSDVIFPTATLGRGTIPFTFNHSWNRFQWKVGGEYDVARDSMLYLNVQTGYNPGTFRTAPGVEGQAVDPQTMLGYTAGMKNLFLDGRLRFNVEGFYYNYKNLLVNSLNFNTGILSTNNAPDTHIKGVQVDLDATPLRKLQLTASLAYLDAKFTDFEAGVPGDVTNYAGYQLPFAPDFTATLSAQYSFELAGKGTLRPGVSTYISSSYWTIFSHTSNLYQPSYTKTDLNLTYYSPGERWDIGGYVKNLENTASQGAGSETGRPYPYAGSAYFDAPRQFGVKLHVKF